MDSVAKFLVASVKWRNLARKRNAELYNATRGVCEVHYRELFPTLETKLNWKENSLILDHGSGCGSTAFDFILPLAQKWNSKIIGLDNSPSMTEFAREKFSNDRIQYVSGEITSRESPVKDLKFDIIFSLYTLHMVDDYKKELKALHDLLSDNGEIFMVIVVHTPFFGLFQKLMDHELWGETAKEHLVVPEWSLTHENEEQILKNGFENAGFVIQSCSREERTHAYQNVDQWSDFAFALNSFAKLLPENECEDLQALYRKYFRETETKTYDPKTGAGNAAEKYILHFEVVNVLAKRKQK